MRMTVIKSAMIFNILCGSLFKSIECTFYIEIPASTWAQVQFVDSSSNMAHQNRPSNPDDPKIYDDRVLITCNHIQQKENRKKCSSLSLGYEDKKLVYEKAFFHAVYNLNVETKPAIYIDYKLVSSLPKEFMVGFIPGDIEYPDFEDFGDDGYRDFDRSNDCTVDFKNKIHEVGGIFVVESNQKKNIWLYSLYLCINNIQTFVRHRTEPVAAFEVFVQTAQLMNKYYRNETPRTSCFGSKSRKRGNGNASMRKALEKSMPTMLKKMIDPCFVMQSKSVGVGDIGRGFGDDSARREKADSYCDVFCIFLSNAHSIFFELESKSYSRSCASIQSGRCDRYSEKCICSKKSKNRMGFAATSLEPMLICNNLIRLQLNP